MVSKANCIAKNSLTASTFQKLQQPKHKTHTFKVRSLQTLKLIKNSGTHCIGGWVGLRASLYIQTRGRILCLCEGSGTSYQVHS
jgi:hypothetical protein